jgi:hypothetical protein
LAKSTNHAAPHYEVFSIRSALKRVEFVSDKMSYIIIRGRLFHIIVLNVQAPTEDKIDDVKTASMRNWNVNKLKRSKAIPVTGRGGL